MRCIVCFCLLISSFCAVAASDDDFLCYVGVSHNGGPTKCCKRCVLQKPAFDAVQEDGPDPVPSIVERIPGVAQFCYQAGTWWYDQPWDQKIADLCKLYWGAYAVALFLF